MTEIFIGQSETLHESSVLICIKTFFCFNGHNYLFNLLRTIEKKLRTLNS